MSQLGKKVQFFCSFATNARRSADGQYEIGTISQVAAHDLLTDVALRVQLI
jgi:hypothetical protein|tara:strand:+ start:158 stop:310 length:153 start_codon:yes stop_codon:yes gene_type:complete